jgi:hypothetical protein
MQGSLRQVHSPQILQQNPPQTRQDCETSSPRFQETLQETEQVQDQEMPQKTQPCHPPHCPQNPQPPQTVGSCVQKTQKTRDQKETCAQEETRDQKKTRGGQVPRAHCAHPPQAAQMARETEQVQDPPPAQKSRPQDPPLQTRDSQKQVENPHQLEAEKVETAPETLQKPRLPQTLPRAREEGEEGQPPLVDQTEPQVPPAHPQMQEPQMPQTPHQARAQV